MMSAGIPVRLPALLSAIVPVRSHRGLGTLVVMAAFLQAPEVPGRLRQDAPPSPKADRREFHFTRAVYSGYGFGYSRRRSWATDYPKADRQFLMGVHRLLSHLDLSSDENPILLD